MPTSQEQYDEAMFKFSQGDYEAAITALTALVRADPGDFDAQLALGMAFYRQGDYQAAIREGHRAEELRPKEQLAHTNLSLFYMKAGDKQKAEHHGLQARIAGWRGDMAPPTAGEKSESELELAKPDRPPPPKLPDMPWKKKKDQKPL
jgi:Flp pilus assembly protein TadD